MDSFIKLGSVFMLRDAVDYGGLFFHTPTFGGLVQLHLSHLFDDTHSVNGEKHYFFKEAFTLLT